MDPRIYRTGLIAVVLAAIVLAFSLQDQPGALPSNLSPQAFSGQSSSALMNQLTSLGGRFPRRPPGSLADARLAETVAGALAQDGFTVSQREFSSGTVAGTRRLRTVIGVLPGRSPGSVVVVSHRDAASTPGLGDLSGTVVMLALAQALKNETQQRSVVLVSTSGTVGAHGTAELAQDPPGPVDAVITLGDLASARARQPVILPWSNAQLVASPVLRNTLAAALGAQAQLPPGSPSFVSDLLHVALPMVSTDEAPFDRAGISAALLSLAGERGSTPGEPISAAQLANMSQAVQQAVSALGNGPSVPSPVAYLLFDGKVVPRWAIDLLVLALIVPVLLASIDALARGRRRGHRVARSLAWVISTAIPFVLIFLIILVARLSGLLPAAPPSPVRGGLASVGGGALAFVIVLALLVLAALLFLRPWLLGGTAPRLRARKADPAPAESSPASRSAGRSRQRLQAPGPIEDLAGRGAVVSLVLSLVVIGIWLRNPFAAGLMVPALHCWLWATSPGARMPRPVSVLLLLAGLAVPVAAAIYYAATLGLGPVSFAWNAVVLAGGAVGAVQALIWSLGLGCTVCAATIALRHAVRPRAAQTPVSVRGPMSYAGPGSLGPTKSVLRR